MCCNTKRKIADGLLEVLRQKPLRKVKVHDIMDCRDMKRQSFYYHFQDIYGVVEWLYEEDFAKALGYDKAEDFEGWFCHVIQIIKENRFFYQKVLEAVERERLVQALYPLVKEEIDLYIMPGKSKNALAQEFAARSLCHFMLDMVEKRESPEEKEVVEAVKNIAELLQLSREKNVA